MPPDTNMTSAEARILEDRMEHLRTDLARLIDVMQDVQRKLDMMPTMVATVDNIRTELGRGSAAMSDHERRLQQIEQTLPGLKELRRWVIAGVLAGVGMLGTALIKLVIVDAPAKTAVTTEAARGNRP